MVKEIIFNFVISYFMILALATFLIMIIEDIFKKKPIIKILSIIFFINIIFIYCIYNVFKITDNNDLLFLKNNIEIINKKDDFIIKKYKHYLFKKIDNVFYFNLNILNYNTNDETRLEFMSYLVSLLSKEEQDELCVLIVNSLKNNELTYFNYRKIINFILQSLEIEFLTENEFYIIEKNLKENKESTENIIKDILDECKACIK